MIQACYHAEAIADDGVWVWGGEKDLLADVAMKNRPEDWLRFNRGHSQAFPDDYFLVASIDSSTALADDAISWRPSKVHQEFILSLPPFIKWDRDKLKLRRTICVAKNLTISNHQYTTLLCLAPMLLFGIQGSDAHRFSAL